MKCIRSLLAIAAVVCFVQAPAFAESSASGSQCDSAIGNFNIALSLKGRSAASLLSSALAKASRSAKEKCVIPASGSERGSRRNIVLLGGQSSFAPASWTTDGERSRTLSGYHLTGSASYCCAPARARSSESAR